jgi:hypothetical protein
MSTTRNNAEMSRSRMPAFVSIFLSTFGPTKRQTARQTRSVGRENMRKGIDQADSFPIVKLAESSSQGVNKVAMVSPAANPTKTIPMPRPRFSTGVMAWTTARSFE